MSTHVDSVAGITVRNEPVQARAAHRVEALLDAAAGVIEAHGIEHLTTALVAERAGASIGTVYRYFPDRVAVLVALAERNLERMRHAVGRAMLAEYDGWEAAIDAMVEAMIETFRTVPSFRVLRTGEALDLGPGSRRAVAPEFAADVEAFLVERFGLQADAAARQRLELAVGGLDALVTYAFLHDRDGDPRYLALGAAHVRAQLTPIFAGEGA